MRRVGLLAPLDPRFILSSRGVCLFGLEHAAACDTRRKEPLPYPFQASAPSPLERGIERLHAGDHRGDLRQGQRKAAQRNTDEHQHFFVGVRPQRSAILRSPPARYFRLEESAPLLSCDQFAITSVARLPQPHSTHADIVSVI